MKMLDLDLLVAVLAKAEQHGCTEVQFVLSRGTGTGKPPQLRLECLWRGERRELSYRADLPLDWYLYNLDRSLDRMTASVQR